MQKMLDFVDISMSFKKDLCTVRPNFISYDIEDIMFRGGDFYAIWDYETGFWTTDFNRACDLIDKQLYRMAFEEHGFEKSSTTIKLLKYFNSDSLLTFKRYCRTMSSRYVELDRDLYFSNDVITKNSYATTTLSYPLAEGSFEAYDELISTLYSEEERRKIEWAIGSIISGDSKNIQKFYVFYGAPGTGKSTILNIISMLFEGYVATFDSKALAKGSEFALETLKDNPLIAIEHEGSFKQIEDNRKINAIVSHDVITVNEKFKSQYPIKFRTTIFMGTNEPVKITDANSGLVRRMIVIVPTGQKIEKRRYLELMDKIQYELGAIAHHCLSVYRDLGPMYYDNYVPVSMIESTNHFYNFMLDNLDFFSDPEGVSLSTAWLRYKNYCDDANISFPMQKMVFKHELKSYFKTMSDPSGHRSYTYKGLLIDKLLPKDKEPEPEPVKSDSWLAFSKTPSFFDLAYSWCKAQYANESGKPMMKWDNCSTTLFDISTDEIHYVMPPRNMIVIDFDLKDENGNKSFELNYEAASKWPPTYAELSKSGAGIHLHYIYTGDASSLSRIFDKDIEVKVFVGNASLRRKLTLCNALAIATLSSGLPLKGVKKKMLDSNTIKNEKHLRALIMKSLRKENLGYTKPEIDFIQFLLDKAYDSGMGYDVTDLMPAIQEFALGSHNQAEYCYQTVESMKFKSKEEVQELPDDYLDPYLDEECQLLPGPKLGEDNIIIFDTECYSNLFLLCWKIKGKDMPCVRMYNPTPEEIEAFCKLKIVGYNNRKYDNHLLYARMLGYNNQQLYELSQRIINGDKDDNTVLFGQAYGLSYSDVLDFLSSAHKMGLKKWEIKLQIPHKEMDIPWDQPIPENMWDKLGDYCCNDVLATEAVWNFVEENDWKAREILADLSELTVNNSTNQHTGQIILGDDKNAVAQFIHTDLATIFPGYKFSKYGFPKEEYYPGAKLVKRKSWYRGQDPGEGGRVYAAPGIHYNVATLDVGSMHPHSAIRLNIFGDKYTQRLKDLVDARMYIKHGDFEKASQLFDGKLTKYLDNPDEAAALADALKTAINSVYGLTYKKGSRFYDPRNEDNIVAKYGALFMINLEKEVKDKGYTVVHIKTDSIKIANADNEIIQFVMDYGMQYGFEFEHESTYRKMCLVNDSVFVALYEDPAVCEERYGYIPGKNKKHPNEWTATGAQFQIPYVFKTLFSGEPIEQMDLTETKSVSTALYLDFNEDLPDVSQLEKERDKKIKKEEITQEELDIYNEEIAKGHAYHFIGKVGLFCPILPGSGGAILLRKNAQTGKYDAVTGTKKSRLFDPNEEPTWRWMEKDMVDGLEKWDCIDRRYFDSLANDAIETIGKYGDFEIFRDPNEPIMNIPETGYYELPFK